MSHTISRAEECRRKQTKLFFVTTCMDAILESPPSLRLQQFLCWIFWLWLRLAEFQSFANIGVSMIMSLLIPDSWPTDLLRVWREWKWDVTHKETLVQVNWNLESIQSSCDFPHPCLSAKTDCQCQTDPTLWFLSKVMMCNDFRKSWVGN